MIDHFADTTQSLFAASDGELDPAVLTVSLTARNPIAPFGIHILCVQIRCVVNVHIAIETTKAVLHR
jgi:hypothetical protein